MTEIIDLTFKLTQQGLHLLRNKYTYHMIAYNEIESAYLVKGRSVKNWAVIMAFGVFFLILAMFLSYLLISGLWIDEKTVRFYNVFGHGLIAVMILGGVGMISIYSAVKTVPIIQITTNNKTYRLRVLKNLKKLAEILEFFRSHGVNVIR